MEKGVKLEKNFLNEVIFRVDFETIEELSNNNKEAAKKFHNKIDHIFPNHHIQKEGRVNLDINLKTGLQKITEDDSLCWIFTNDKNNKLLILTSTSLVLNYKKEAYVSFKKFLNEILQLVDSLAQYSPSNLKFLGLRYINLINDREINENINKYINPSLSKYDIIHDLDSDEQMVQVFNKFNFTKKNYLITLQYGFYNSSFPNPDAEQNFILDYDCITKNIDNLMDIGDKLKEMNKLIFKKFEYSITDNFKKYMGETYDNTI